MKGFFYNQLIVKIPQCCLVKKAKNTVKLKAPFLQGGICTLEKKFYRSLAIFHIVSKRNIQQKRKEGDFLLWALDGGNTTLPPDKKTNNVVQLKSLFGEGKDQFLLW